MFTYSSPLRIFIRQYFFQNICIESFNMYGKYNIHLCAGNNHLLSFLPLFPNYTVQYSSGVRKNCNFSLIWRMRMQHHHTVVMRRIYFMQQFSDGDKMKPSIAQYGNTRVRGMLCGVFLYVFSQPCLILLLAFDRCNPGILRHFAEIAFNSSLSFFGDETKQGQKERESVFACIKCRLHFCAK